jgi:hypothetical protein
MVLKTHKIPLPNYMGCLIEFYESLTRFYYENEFQNPQVFHQHLRFSPDHSTLVDDHPTKCRIW